MSMADADPPPLAVHRLRLLSDQPVEGCELVPDVFMLNGVSPLSVRLEYKWYRCMDKMACSWCGKTPVVTHALTRTRTLTLTRTLALTPTLTLTLTLTLTR